MGGCAGWRVDEVGDQMERWVGEVMSGCVGWCVHWCVGRVCGGLGEWVGEEVSGVRG